MTSDEDALVRTSEPAVPGMAAPLPPPPGSSYPVRRRRPSGPWLLAILVILLLAAGTLTTLLIRQHSDRAATPGSPSSQPTASASQTAPTSSAATSGSASASPSASASQPPAPPALLPRGKEAPVSAIPWNQVDAGWSLHAWHASSNWLALTPSTLYLVNPIGGRYRITTLVPNTGLVDWSPDRRRAVLDTYSSTGRTVVVQEIALSTGRRLSSFVLGNRSLRGYAGPGGHSLLLQYSSTGNGPRGLERVSTSGVHQVNFADGGSITGELVGSVARYTADGSTFFMSGQRGLAIFSNDGVLLKQIGYPSASYCNAGRWWSDQTVLGSCSLRSATGNSGSANLVLISVSTGRITQLTRAVRPDYGFTVAWRFSGGIIAQRATSCGPGALATIDSAGTAHPYSYRLPVGASGQAGLRSVFNDRAILVTSACGSGSPSLISLNLRSGIATVLLGPGLNGGSVLD